MRRSAKFPSSASRTRSPRQPLHLEALEDRTLPSVSVSGPTLQVGALTVEHNQYDAGHILVQFKPSALGAGSAALALSGTTLVAPLGLVPGLYLVNLSGSLSVSAAVAEYQADSLVTLAEPDYSLTTATLPNDALFGQQPNLYNTGQNGGTPNADIHAVNAWSVTTGSPSQVVAVNDTGIDYEQPDLYQNIWINQAEIPASRRANLIDVDGDGLITFADLNDPRNQGPGKITDVNHDGVIDAADILAPMIKDAQGQDTGLGGWACGSTQDGDTAHPDDLIGWNFVANNNNPLDDNGHGTAVAGIIGAKGNNGIGVAGVAWQVQLMAVKILNASGGGSVGEFINGLNYELAHGAKLSNNSWEGDPNEPILEEALANAQSQGHVLVFAAGNDGNNNDQNPVYPGSYNLDNLVSVAATDSNDNLASFSNYGATTVALAAPGVNVLSTLPGGSYGASSGTSVAAPQVTGVLALVWGQHPDWGYQQVIQQVLKTSDPLPTLQGKTVSGGRLDAAAAVGYTAPATRVISASVTGPAVNTLSSINVQFDQPVNPDTFAPGTVTFTGPDGQAIPVQSVNVVSGSSNRSYVLAVPLQSSVGTYTFQIGPPIQDANGKPIRSYLTTFQIIPPKSYSNTTPVVIPVPGTASSTVYVPQSFLVVKAQVRLNLTHSSDSDLVVFLQAPDGTNVLLVNRRGGAGQNFWGTVFDDSASLPIAQGQSPFTGTFQPETALSNFQSHQAQGNWTLWVQDQSGAGVGTLLDWTLTLTNDTTPASPPSGGGPAGAPPASVIQHVIVVPPGNPVPPVPPTPPAGNNPPPSDNRFQSVPLPSWAIDAILATTGQNHQTQMAVYRDLLALLQGG